MPKYATISQGLLDVKRQSIDQQVNNKCNQNFNHVLENILINKYLSKCQDFILNIFFACIDNFDDGACNYYYELSPLK
jgi:hypothetical protein